jgi:hypothetical protein
MKSPQTVSMRPDELAPRHPLACAGRSEPRGPRPRADCRHWALCTSTQNVQFVPQHGELQLFDVFKTSTSDGWQIALTQSFGSLTFGYGSLSAC